MYVNPKIAQPFLGAPPTPVTLSDGVALVYVYDVYGSLVRLTGRDIVLDLCDGGDYDARVLARDPHDFGQMFVLHNGTENECHRYIKTVGDSLVVLYITDVESTRCQECKCGEREWEIAF